MSSVRVFVVSLGLLVGHLAQVTPPNGGDVVYQWATTYAYGSLNCSDDSLLSVTSWAMNTCYVLSPTGPSFLTSCANNGPSGGAEMQVDCVGYSGAECQGEPMPDFPCPYKFSLPEGCFSGLSAKCETSNPNWLSWPGFVLYSNSSASSETCATDAPVSLFGFNPGCSEYNYLLYRWSREAMVVDNNLVVNTYMKPGCVGTYTTETVVEGLDSCHQKIVSTSSLKQLGSGALGAKVAASGDAVYGSASLSSIPSVQYAEGPASSPSSSSPLSPEAIAAIAAGGAVALGGIVTFVLIQRRRKEREAQESINAGLLDHQG